MRADELFSGSFPKELASFFDPKALAWDWVKAIGKAVDGKRFIDPSAMVHPSAVIEGNVWIGPKVRVGPFAYLRGGVIALEGAVLGHAGEFKNCILMEGAAAAHYNYVGDSVMGKKSHLGAGAICSNLRLDEKEVKVEGVSTGLQKLGAMLGDGAQVGCNAVLNPGTILHKGALVSPVSAAKGIITPGPKA